LALLELDGIGRSTGGVSEGVGVSTDSSELAALGNQVLGALY